MPYIVTIQFSKAGKMYNFNAGSLELVAGDRVIVETERGTGVGQVVRPPAEKDAEAVVALTPVLRKATAEDLATVGRITLKEQEAYRFCVNRIIERNMPMKLVQVEYQFDSSKAVFFFTADGRVDFRDLVKDLAHSFHTRIEMRQIGVRDEAKMTGGIGICGRELCCSSFLREFQPVSVKMAKEQNLALNPNKISGQCGRLLCCLDYEYETYCCLRKNFPKAGKRVRTVNAVGLVDKVNILTGNISLKLDDNKIIVIKREEIIGEGAPAATPTGPAPQTPPQSVQRTRERRPELRRKQEKTSLESYTQAEHGKMTSPSPAPKEITAAEPAVTEPSKSGPQRKKHRSRKHGHRKPSETTPNSTAPKPSSGA
ncbi:MAG: stage 0 sporulation family protein [Desulfuromonadaceae bacterium]|nr:stage 0 sporulation family protein [Desulfuromonadaceae bacterium]MDD5106245.1 stage 0 sporulation family protein [Desulfuromonadaceae bacterium]